MPAPSCRLLHMPGFAWCSFNVELTLAARERRVELNIPQSCLAADGAVRGHVEEPAGAQDGGRADLRATSRHGGRRGALPGDRTPAATAALIRRVVSWQLVMHNETGIQLSIFISCSRR